MMMIDSCSKFPHVQVTKPHVAEQWIDFIKWARAQDMAHGMTM